MNVLGVYGYPGSDRGYQMVLISTLGLLMMLPVPSMCDVSFSHLIIDILCEMNLRS